MDGPYGHVCEGANLVGGGSSVAVCTELVYRQATNEVAAWTMPQGRPPVRCLPVGTF
jgi:hypothetical protein